MSAFVISCGSSTGGCGKTTFSIEIAHIISNKYKTLLIGLDENHELSKFLGIEDCGVDSSLIFGGERNQVLYKKTRKKNLYIIPSSIRLTHSLYQEITPNTLQEYIEEELSDFDFIIIDSPPALNILKINTILASHFIIIPCGYNYKNYEGALTYIRQIRELVPETNNFGVVMNSLNKGHKKKIRDTDKALEKLKDYIFETKIPIDSSIEEAQKKCLSLFEYNKNSRAYKEFNKLVKNEILKNIEV